MKGKGKAKRDADANRAERLADQARKCQSVCAEKNSALSINVPAGTDVVEAPILSHLPASKLPPADTSEEAPNADAEENNVPAPIALLSHGTDVVAPILSE